MIMKLIALFSILGVPLWALETVQVSQSVVINAPIEEVCQFATNPLNDHLWRREVNDISVEGEVDSVGSVFTEDAFIGIRRHFITMTELVAYECPSYATFVTVESNPYYLKSHRSFEALSSNKTRFTYTVDFDRRMIRPTFGFNAKPGLVAGLYSYRMFNYLHRLKRLF